MLGFVVALAVLSRSLPATDYGTFRQCWTVYLLAVPVASAGLAQSLFYFVPRSGRNGDWHFVKRTLLITGLAGLAIGALLVLGSPLVAAGFQNSGGVWIFAVFSLFLATSIPLQLSDGIFMSIGRAELAAIFNVLNRTTVLIGLALPAMLGLGLLGGLWVLGALQATVLLLLVLLARRTHDCQANKSPPTRATLREQLSFAAPAILASVAGSLFLQMDKLVVGRLASPSDFALYSNGAFENPVISLVVAAGSAASAAELVRLRAAYDSEGFLELWSSMTARITLTLVPAGAFLFFFAREAVVALFSARYAESAGVFALYALLTPVRIVAFSMLFGSLNRNVTYLLGHVVACAAVGVAAPALYLWVGLPGPAIALVAISYALAGAFLASGARALGVEVRRILPYRYMIRVGVIGTACAWGARAAVTRLVPGGGLLQLAIGAGAFGVSCLVALVLTGSLRPPAPITTGALEGTRGA